MTLTTIHQVIEYVGTIVAIIRSQRRLLMVYRSCQFLKDVFSEEEGTLVAKSKPKQESISRNAKAHVLTRKRFFLEKGNYGFRTKKSYLKYQTKKNKDKRIYQKKVYCFNCKNLGIVQMIVQIGTRILGKIRLQQLIHILLLLIMCNMKNDE